MSGRLSTNKINIMMDKYLHEHLSRIDATIANPITSPILDYLGQELKPGNFIIHPDGDCGQISYSESDGWLVYYYDGNEPKSLAIQTDNVNKGVKSTLTDAIKDIRNIIN